MTNEMKLHTYKKKTLEVKKQKTKHKNPIGISEPMADYVDVTCLNVRVACRFKVKTAWVHFVIISRSVRSRKSTGRVLSLVSINSTIIHYWHQCSYLTTTNETKSVKSL